MFIMDDVLDVIDVLDETLKKSRRSLRRFVRGESGASTLIMVLIMLVVGSLILTPMMGFLYSALRVGQTHEATAHQFYSADTGIEDAMWKIKLYQLPTWLQGQWGDVYDDEYNYQLSDQFNSNVVDVTIRPVWLLEGLETPGHGREPHAELVTVGNLVTGDNDGGTFKIAIVADTPGNYKLDRLGVWLPPGWHYVGGSCTLEDPIEAGAAYCTDVRQEPHNGGTALTWNYSPVVEFTDFPPGGSNRIVVTFDYTLDADAYPSDWVFCWCRTNRHDIYLSWSGEMKTFELTSTATDPETGRDTSIRAYTLQNEAVGTGTALNGDYVVTGNALMRNHDNDSGGERERLYYSSSGTISDSPDGAVARKIMLYWSGWKDTPSDAWFEDSADINAWTLQHQQDLLDLAYSARVTSVAVTIKVGVDTYVIPEVVADTCQVLPESITPEGHTDYWNHGVGWSYACSTDITDYVRNHFGASFDGNATYTVGHAQLGSTPPTDEDMQGVWGTGSSDVFIVGAAGTILHYDGGSWTDESDAGFGNLKGIWGTSSTNAKVVGDPHRSSRWNPYYYNVVDYNGTSWSFATTPQSSNTLYGVWGSSASDVWAAGGTSNGNTGAILHYNGTAWSASSIPSGTRTLRGVWGASANDVYAVGMRGNTYCTILHWNGSAWSAPWSISNPRVDLYGVWGSSSSNVYAVGGGSGSGKILYYNGSTWAEVAPAGTNPLYGIWGSSENDVFAVGASGSILHWDGSNWATMSSGSGANLYGVWGSASNDVYAVGQAGAILHYDGTEWRSITGGYELYEWKDGHVGETVIESTDYTLGDNHPVGQLSYAAWSVFTVYSSPETAGHQLYLYDTYRHWQHYQDTTITVENFLAPANVGSDPEAARFTAFVCEGDSHLTGDGSYTENVYMNGQKLNTGGSGTALANNNVWNSISNATSPSPDGLDLDTFVVSGSSGIIDPGDSSAELRMTTKLDVWQVVYMVLSFRSDVTASGFGSYVVLR